MTGLKIKKGEKYEIALLSVLAYWHIRYNKKTSGIERSSWQKRKRPLLN